MKKHFYSLALGALSLFSTLTLQAQQTICDSVGLFASYGVSGNEPEFIKCEKHSQYAIDTYTSTQEPLFLLWTTKSGELLQQGNVFSHDTTGEFVLHVEGNGCLAERPLTIIDAPEIYIDANKLTYCQNETKPTIFTEVFFVPVTPTSPESYSLYKDDQFYGSIQTIGTFSNVSAGVYEIRNDNQQCWNSLAPTLTITEETCEPELCEPIKDSVYQTEFDGQIHTSCDLAGWDLTFPEGKKPEGVTIIWKQNGEEIQRNNIALSIDVTAINSPDTYSVETSSENCSWSKEISIIKDSINTEITTNDPNFKHCPETPIIIEAKGNEHLTGETYTWEKKNASGSYVTHGTGTTLPNPEIGEYRMYIETARGCFSTPTSFSIYEGVCSNNCPSILINKMNFNNPTVFIPEYNPNRYILCERYDLVLEANTIFETKPISTTGSITWYEVLATTEQNRGGNPIYISSPGTYVAKYVDQNNCNITSDTVHVYSSEPIDLSIIPMDGSTELEIVNEEITICEGSTVTLNPNPYYHQYYEWELNAAQISTDVTIDVTENGYYTLQVVDYNGCWQDAALNVNINSDPNCTITGLNELTTSGIEFAPNPTSNSISIIGNIDLNTVQVVSQLGQIDILNVENGSIDLSNYQTGIYTLLIERNGTVEAHKIVKQ